MTTKIRKHNQTSPSSSKSTPNNPEVTKSVIEDCEIFIHCGQIGKPLQFTELNKEIIKYLENGSNSKNECFTSSIIKRINKSNEKIRNLNKELKKLMDELINLDNLKTELGNLNEKISDVNKDFEKLNGESIDTETKLNGESIDTETKLNESLKESNLSLSTLLSELEKFKVEQCKSNKKLNILKGTLFNTNFDSPEEFKQIAHDLEDRNFEYSEFLNIQLHFYNIFYKREAKENVDDIVSLLKPIVMKLQKIPRIYFNFFYSISTHEKDKSREQWKYIQKKHFSYVKELHRILLMFRSEERICMIYANNFESWDYLKSINLDDECYDLRKWYPKLEQFEWKFTFNDTIFNYNNENQKILELLKKYCFGGKLQIIFTFYVNIPVQLKAACKIIDICKENSKNCQNIKFNIFYTATKKIPHGISVNCDSFILKTTLYRLAEYIGDTPTDKLFPNIIKIIILHNEIDNDILDKAGKELENLKELRSLVICYSQETSDKTTKEQFMEFLKKMPKLIHFLSLKETNGYFKDFGCELKLAFPNLTQLEMLGNRENVLEDFKEDYFLNFDKLEILRLECLGNYKENSENKSNRTISEQFPLSLKVLINDCDNTKSLSCYLESLSTKDSNHMDQIDQEKLTCNCLKRKDKFETLLHQNKLKEIISAINYKIATGKMDYYIEFWKNHDLSPEDISFKIYSKNSYTKNFNCFKGGELSISPKYKQYKDSSLLIEKCNDLLEWENLKESQAERDNTEKQLTYLIRQMYSDIFAILEMVYKNVLNLSKGNTNNATPKDIPYDTILRSFNIVHSFDMCKLRNRSVHELYQNNEFMQQYAVCILVKFIYVNNKPILK